MAFTRNVSLIAAFGLFATSLVMTGSAGAQEPEEAAREAAEQRLRDEQRREAVRNDPDALTIPFERVLAAPDDINLNIAYARQQVAAGDLKEAGATLERVLLIDPNRHDVRVLYGLVLYRLGLFDRARYELELAIESGKLPATLEAEATTYLNRIKYQQKRTRLALTFTAGVDYESNRNQAPSSGQLLLLDTPLPANAKVDDLATIFSVRGRLVHDLGSQEGHMLHADASYYRSDKHEFDSLDLDAVTLAVGGTWYAGNWSFTPRLLGGFYWLGDEDTFPATVPAGIDGRDYLKTLGGEMEVAYRWSPQFKTYVLVRGEDEDFRNLPSFQTAALRSGRRISGRAGATWRISPTQSVNVEGLYMDKNGAAGFESYERYGVNAQHSWLLGRGAFSLIGLWAENSSYDANDPFISAAVRDEWLYRARVTVGAPISFFAPGLPETLKDINLMAQYEYETVDSNLLNFDYKTHKLAFLVSKRFSF